VGARDGAVEAIEVADQIGQAARTGLGFLPLTDHRTYDQQWDPLWRSSDLILVPGEEANGSPHAIALGAVDEIVDGPNPPGSAPFRHVQQSVWDAHAQNASWGQAHPDDGERNGDGSPNANASVVGVDTVEIWNRASDPEREIDYAENRWNAGFRFAAVGASDDHFKEIWAVAGPGQPTTWVFAPTPSERGVIAGIRAGHTAVSAGPLAPMVTLSGDFEDDGVFEAISGDEVAAAKGEGATLRVRVKRGIGTSVVIYAAPGRGAGPIAVLHPIRADQTFKVPVTVGPAWYRAEVRGFGGPPGLGLSSYNPFDALLALTSPIFVDTSSPAAPRPEVRAPAVDSGAADHAVGAIDEAGVFAGFGAVALSAGAAHVVAEVDVAGTSRVEYRSMSRDGAHALAPAVVLSGASRSARFPAVAANGHDVWVAWQDEPGSQKPHRTDVVLRHSSDDGRTWGAPRRITTDGHAQHPALAVTPDGHAVVAWSDNRSGAFEVTAQVLDVDTAPVVVSAPGKVTSAGNPADSRSPRYPASLFPTLAVSPAGAIAVGWTDDRRDPDPLWTGSTGGGEGTDPDDWEIFAAVRPPGGRWSAPVDVSADATRADRHPSLAFAADGALFAAWDAKVLRSSGVNLGLRWSRSADGGRTWSRGAALAAHDTAMSERPRLVAGTGATVRVVWYDSRAADWRWSLWGASLSGAGASTVRRLTGAGNATWPAVAGDLVVFTSDRGAVRVQRDPTQGVFVLRVP
jgi:hypothetical protein